MPTTIIGIDAATKPNKVGLARGRFDSGRLVVEEVLLGSDVESIPATIASWIRSSTVIAIDAPLGWPVAMAAALKRHAAGEQIHASGDQMFARLTDQVVHRRLGKKPLEVGANLIARAALAALALIGAVREATGSPLPLLWAPGASEAAAGVVEVYPAATLIGRKISVEGYKKAGDDGRAARRRLLDRLLPEIELRVPRDRLEETDHAVDAVVCLIAAADFLSGGVDLPPATELDRVRREGWIWFKSPAA